MKKKVLQFTIADSKGGRTQYILNLWRHINHEKYIFDFVTFSPFLDFEIDLIKDGCKVFHMKNYPEQNKIEFINEFNAVLENGYDIVEIHTSFWNDTIVEQLARYAGIKKIIIHGHSTGITKITAKNKDREVEYINKHNSVKARLNDGIATDFWACSEDVANWLFKPQISKDKIRIIPNAIDTDRFRFCREKRESIRRKLHIDDQFVLGFVGRLEPVKNLEFLLDIFFRLHDIRAATSLLIVGEGSERSMIEKKIKEHSLEKDIMLVGNKNNPEDYYQAMDCFILPSLFEGFSIVLLEAQCMGLPSVVSTRVPIDAVKSGNVVRIPLNDIEKWVEKVFWCMNTEIDRINAYKLIKSDETDIKLQVKHIEELYAE